MTIQEVWDKLEWEGGFEYFHDGSDFKEVKDPEFHRLRLAFVKAWDDLEAYMEENAEVVENEENSEDE